ncbi:hypothetical protein BsWGS_22952 [Bradybaena similaris]
MHYRQFPLRSADFTQVHKEPVTQPQSHEDKQADGKIKHCRIRVEGQLFTIGSALFESLFELVQHYEHTPLYKKMKLRLPVNQQLLDIVKMSNKRREASKQESIQEQTVSCCADKILC